jgi:hypothetical protein
MAGAIDHYLSIIEMLAFFSFLAKISDAPLLPDCRLQP